MPTLHRVCRIDQLPDGQSGTITVAGKAVAVFRAGDDYRAIDDACPHMGASLAGGCVEDGVVTCPWHFWRFRLDDGAWADNPRLKVGAYPVRVAGGAIYVEMPDAPPT